MATIASPSATSLYLNAFDKTIQYEGIIKTIDDDYWTSDIVPILYPMWDSDNDKLEVFVQYKDGTSRMNKTKYSRNQKTGVYKWISYQFDLARMTVNLILFACDKLNVPTSNCLLPVLSVAAPLNSMYLCILV